jgi:hypothetical protein
MCSIPGDRPSTPSEPGGRSGAARPGETHRPGEVDRLGRAIDELADAAQGGNASTQDVATRLAQVWDMVADLDPELARRLAGYDS